MPELPDVTVYVDALQRRILGQRLTRLRIAKPFVLRTFDPPAEDFIEQAVVAIRRMGKRIVIEFEGERFAVIHLMIAGRFRWLPANAKIPGKLGLAAFDFPEGTLLLTEAGSKRRASIHLVQGREGVALLDPGGMEALEIPLETFRDELTAERHTLKRALTDPRRFSGIGNAYSDEILHRARLSPIQMTTSLSGEEIERLFEATRSTLMAWTDRLRREAGERFPENVTAFRDGMAVHGRYGLPCPDCSSPVQRIVYAQHETNYCARCQTEGRLLADRALSRLLHSDWPKSLDDL